LSAVTPDATFATIPLVDRPFESEDFDTNQLDSRIWTFHDPLGDASFFLSGAGTPNARVNIVVPAGLSHDPWAFNNAPRLMQEAQDEDFQLEVKMESSMSARFQEQGVIIEADADNWLRLELHSDGTELRAFATAVVDGVPSVRIHTGIGSLPSAVPLWLRITRTGNQFRHEHSFDGQTWIVNGVLTQPMEVTAVGIFGGNFTTSGSAPAHTAVFDYFFETARPIVPEDTP
jgi:regulation of enolase protein 1 (concanavalin A-like superfamily)